MDKLNNIIFYAGDQILLKRNEIFEGSLQLHGSGNNDHPITLSSFGMGERPVINAGNHECAVTILDEQYWNVSNIETTGGDKAGIFIGCRKDDLLLNNISITNCYVHDVGDTSKIDWDYSKSTGGIIVVNGSFNNAGQPVFYNSVFNNVVVDGCLVRYNNKWTCISISSGKKNGKGGIANYIKNCTVEYSAADGIRMNGVRNSFIEYCVLYRNGAWPKIEGRNLGGLGAWFFDAENCTIQFCEASYVGANTSDGGAFDIDYWQKNSTVQYCYGHNCAGYGVSVFGADAAFPTVNSTVRYNVFCNNGKDTAFAYQGDFYVYTWNGGSLNGVNIHDNISYWNPARDAPSLKHDASYTGNNSNSFTHNIIYSDEYSFVYSRNNTLKCDSNIYWSNAASPVWSDTKNKYYSLSDWQKNSGQDVHSSYTKYAKQIPSWYKYKIPAKPFRKNENDSDIKQGSKAPVFNVNAINQQKINLDDYKRNPVLLCFISLQNLSQLVFIKSMQKQYEEKGLKIILIDESYLTNASYAKQETLLNFISDHELKDIPLITDSDSLNLAEKYNVTLAPTSFLIAGNIILNKWENLALPAQLAFAIEDALKK
ncbi:MAG: right-handed parallel beta-helix repeat-containing protein [Parafilimonas sp.]